MEETALPVIVAEDPLTCVARGSGRALEELVTDFEGGVARLKGDCKAIDIPPAVYQQGRVRASGLYGNAAVQVGLGILMSVHAHPRTHE